MDNDLKVLREFLLLRSQGLFAGEILERLRGNGFDTPSIVKALYPLELTALSYYTIKMEDFILAEPPIERALFRHRTSKTVPTMRVLASLYNVSENEILAFFSTNNLEGMLQDCSARRDDGKIEKWKAASYKALHLLEEHGFKAPKPWWWWPQYDEFCKRVSLNIE